MDLSKLRWTEWTALGGGLLLLVSVFIKWYEARPEVAAANIEGKRGTLSAWDVHSIWRFLLIAAALAPVILAWIVVREHQLSWARGEMTAVSSIAAAGAIFYFGIIDRPGTPSGEIELEWGWYTAMLGSLMMVVGSAMRSGESERARKPPGVL